MPLARKGVDLDHEDLACARWHASWLDYTVTDVGKDLPLL